MGFGVFSVLFVSGLFRVQGFSGVSGFSRLESRCFQRWEFRARLFGVPLCSVVKGLEGCFGLFF